MKDLSEDSWFDDIRHLNDGYDLTTIDQFGDRLLRLARSRLPDRLNRRIDPEDIIQSVFKSFFARNEAGKFEFREAPDIWRLLASITYHKVQRAIRYHGQQQRDVNRETAIRDSSATTDFTPHDVSPTASTVVTMMELLDKILSELPQTHQEIVRLRMENYTIAEIADKTDVSTRTVIRAMKLVRKIATDVCEQP